MYESRERLTIQRLSRLDSQGQKMESRLEQYSVILGIQSDVVYQLSFSRRTSYGVFPLCAPCGLS